MCMSIDEARFSKTIVYAAQCQDGDHLLGYQNNALNLSNENVNAMLLPIPAKNRLTDDDMEKVCIYQEDNLDEDIVCCAAGSADRSFQIFKSGMYTVIVAESFAKLRLAVTKLPKELQIKIPNEVLSAYTRWYPKWQPALCLWTGKSEIKAHPILWKFESMYPETLFYSGLDQHDGTVPNLNAKVERDHTLMIGHYDRGNKVDFTDSIVDTFYMLPKKVMGKIIFADTKNGDWWVNLKDINEATQPERATGWAGLDFKLSTPVHQYAI